MATPYDGGRLRPWLVLGFCPGCLRQVREANSRARYSMPGAQVAVYYHLSCDLERLRPPERQH